VAVVEKGGWGGTCTHRGCIPTKALLAASGRYDGLRNLRRMGIGAAGGTFDFPSIRKHMEQMVRVSALGARKALEEAGVELVQGEARLKSPVEVEIEMAGGERETAKARRIVIAWGSRSALPPGWRLSERVVTSSGFLAGKELPEKALVVGAGAIGLEFATFLAERGKDVSVVEFMDQVLPGEDRDVAETLAGELGKKGIRFFTSTRVEVPETVSGTVRLRGNAPGGTVDLRETWFSWRRAGGRTSVRRNWMRCPFATTAGASPSAGTSKPPSPASMPSGTSPEGFSWPTGPWLRESPWRRECSDRNPSTTGRRMSPPWCTPTRDSEGWDSRKGRRVAGAVPWMSGKPLSGGILRHGLSLRGSASSRPCFTRTASGGRPSSGLRREN